MDFTLTKTQKEYQQRARLLATERLAPEYQEREKRGFVEEELRRQMGEAGLIAPEISEDLGGRGMDRLTSGLIAEEIARGDFSVSYIQIVGSLVGQILSGHARAEVAAEWVPGICSGQEIVGNGQTEPHGGSDAGMPRLKARREGDGYVLNGQKSLSFADQAGAVVVFARTSEEEVRARGISAFFVPLDSPGGEARAIRGHRHHGGRARARALR